ncbi:MAG: hypothetical protein CM1200mP40_24700 [Gammaproteobacteria bacterium]|nr:MAG: hypothetical protein CM1200mP40_24700 [Gammaproteobacteria bacterium]
MAVLFGDACGAVVIEATDEETGLLAANIGCESDAKYAIQITNLGSAYSRMTDDFLYVDWNFEGQEVFKRAVRAMAQACGNVLEQQGLSIADVDLVVPHQANKRILDALAKKVGLDEDRVFINVHKYGNTSAGTIPVALTEALEENKIKPGGHVLMASFGPDLPGEQVWLSGLIELHLSSNPTRVCLLATRLRLKSLKNKLSAARKELKQPLSFYCIML